MENAFFDVADMWHLANVEFMISGTSARRGICLSLFCKTFAKGLQRHCKGFAMVRVFWRSAQLKTISRIVDDV